MRKLKHRHNCLSWGMKTNFKQQQQHKKKKKTKKKTTTKNKQTKNNNKKTDKTTTFPTYISWKALFVPLWSRSWHKHATIKATHSVLDKYCFVLHFWKRKRLIITRECAKFTYPGSCADRCAVSERNCYRFSSMLIVILIQNISLII